MGTIIGRKFRVGDWVQVRSKEEILRTLDSDGQLDGMPFMPEMFAFCGKQFPVYKSAHKTCDTVFPTRGRMVSRAVHLATRCDGSALGGCQAGRLIFWKEEWLKVVDGDAKASLVPLEKNTGDAAAAKCTESDLWAHAQVSDLQYRTSKYVCQATQLPYATNDLSWWDIRQYIEDYVSGNVGLRRILKGMIYSMYYNVSQAGIGLGPVMRWLYDRICWIWGGSRFPRTAGNIPEGHPTPTTTLNLQPGEWVRVKSHREILRTLNTESKNRGMYWDAEMVPYCGGTYRVLKRVTKIVDERTGKMQEMKTPSIVLDTVICQSRYSGCRMFCPRSIYSYWREIWLERVTPQPSSQGLDQQPLAVSLPAGSESDDLVNAQSHTQGLIEIGKD